MELAFLAGVAGTGMIAVGYLPLAIPCGLMAWYGVRRQGRLVVQLRRIYADPPRLDFDELAEPLLPEVDLGAIPDVGDRELVVAFADALVYGTAYTEAMVTSGERALGAALAGRQRAVTRQLDAYDRLRARASSSFSELGSALDQLGRSSWFAEGLDMLVRGSDEGFRDFGMETNETSDVLAAMYAFGFPSMSYERSSHRAAEHLGMAGRWARRPTRQRGSRQNSAGQPPCFSTKSRQ